WRIAWIFIAWIGAENVGTRALEKPEGSTAPGIEESLDRSVGVRRRVMDLRDVVHRRDTVVELRQSAEQLADVHVLRTVYGGEREQNVFEIRGIRARRARAVVDQEAVGEKAAQRGLELVVVRVDEARHDDLAARVDLAGAAGAQVRPDGEDLLALDQHVGLDEVTYRRVHRRDVAAADDVAPASPAAVLRRVVVLRRGRA